MGSLIAAVVLVLLDVWVGYLIVIGYKLAGDIQVSPWAVFLAIAALAIICLINTLQSPTRWPSKVSYGPEVVTHSPRHGPHN